MDLNQFKDIIEKDGGKIVIVENDKPTMVVMSFEEYKKKEQPKPSLQTPAEEMPPATAESEREWRDGLTIEDLPL